MAETNEFDTKEEAQKEAQSMIDKMNSTFCQKHEFALSEQFGDFTIFIKPRR
jgi:nucleoid DNA-binding protein